MAGFRQAHKDSFHRFDKFNLKYNPVSISVFYEHFLAMITDYVILRLERAD
jgi:hypothetical protein